MATTRKKAGAADAEAVKVRQEAESAMGVERGTPASRRIARGRAKGGLAARAAENLARDARATRAGKRGVFKPLQDR